MNLIRYAAAGAALALAISGCASTTPEDRLSAEEREAARRMPPGTGSAVTSFRGAEYVGAFMLDVSGDVVSFAVTGYDSVGHNFLSGRIALPSDFARANDGSVDFRFEGPPDGSTGLIAVNSVPSTSYWPVSGEVRTDATGLLSVRIVGLRVPDYGDDGYAIPGTGGERETLMVVGHLTGTCSAVLPSGEIRLDPEHTINPRCAELLRGL